MAIKVMLVDDEPQIRKILRKVIERNEKFTVVCECDNMTDALILYHKNKPQVIFMDIEINGSSGIDCARVISDMDSHVKIIFATAHSEYMSNAFEMYAFDYLVKPFDIARIEHTLARLLEVEQKPEEKVEKTGKLAIKGKESMFFIDYADIIMVERNNSTTVIYTDSGEQMITSMGLSDVEEKLDKKMFLRSHRSFIINLSKIKSIEPYGRWTYSVKLKGTETDALLTKEKYDVIKEIYG